VIPVTARGLAHVAVNCRSWQRAMLTTDVRGALRGRSLAGTWTLCAAGARRVVGQLHYGTFRPVIVSLRPLHFFELLDAFDHEQAAAAHVSKATPCFGGRTLLPGEEGADEAHSGCSAWLLGK
jgi:hypothetical protein